MQKCVKQVGQLFGTAIEPNPQGGRIYAVDGLMRALGSSHGMSQPYIIEECFVPVNWDKD